MSQKSITELTRPKTIDEIVGNNHIKEIIKYDIEGAKLLNQPIPSYILVGPPGTSKSTWCGVIASMTGGEVFKKLGTEFKTAENVIDLASMVEDGDVVYIEEAHAIGKKAQIVLLEWIENFKILGLDEENVAKVIFLFPTTNSGKLSKPLRERCKTLYTTFYSIEDLEEIILNAGKKLEIDLSTDKDGLRLLAESSRGTPRIAVAQRLNSVLKVMAVDNQPFSKALVQKMLDIQKIGPFGLESGDFKYCEVLYERSKESASKAVSLGTISKSTGFDIDVIEVIEQYLLQCGIITLSTSGRSLTDLGLKILGKEPIKNENKTTAKIKAAVKEVDLDYVKELLKDPEVRSAGMKNLAPLLGYKYPQEIPLIKEILGKCGYTTKKKAGIISL